MKLFTLVFLFLLISTSTTFAQLDLELSYNDTHVGRNFNLLLKKNFKEGKHTLYGGLKYHIGNRIHDNQNNTYWNRFYPRNFLQSIGLTVGYQRNYNLLTKAKFFWFFDSQFTSSGTYGVDYLPIYNSEELYRRWVAIADEIKAQENNFGIGIKTDLSEKWSLIVRGGGGIVFFWSIPEAYENGVFRDNSPTWEFSELFTLGFQYNLK